MKFRACRSCEATLFYPLLYEYISYSTIRESDKDGQSITCTRFLQLDSELNKNALLASISRGHVWTRSFKCETKYKCTKYCTDFHVKISFLGLSYYVSFRYLVGVGDFELKVLSDCC